MNQTVSIFAIGFKIKKLIALVVIVMTVSLTLPVMAVFYLVMPTLSCLENTPNS